MPFQSFGHPHWLSCGLDHGAPNVTFWLDFLASFYHHGKWYVNECVMPTTHQHVGLSSHSSMHRALSQDRAIHVILGPGWHAPNSITWVYVFKCNGQVQRPEKAFDLVVQEETD